MMSSKHGRVAYKNSYALDDQVELGFCPAVYSESSLGENTISSLSALKVYIIVPQEILFPERKYRSHLYFSHTYPNGKVFNELWWSIHLAFGSWHSSIRQSLVPEQNHFNGWCYSYSDLIKLWVIIDVVSYKKKSILTDYGGGGGGDFLL